MVSLFFVILNEKSWVEMNVFRLNFYIKLEKIKRNYYEKFKGFLSSSFLFFSVNW